MFYTCWQYRMALGTCNLECLLDDLWDQCPKHSQEFDGNLSFWFSSESQLNSGDFTFDPRTHSTEKMTSHILGSSVFDFCEQVYIFDIYSGDLLHPLSLLWSLRLLLNFILSVSIIDHLRKVWILFSSLVNLSYIDFPYRNWLYIYEENRKTK